MSFPVYDFRTDVRNVLVTPQIRARFLRMEPGQVARLHSHDLGHEVFLVLRGTAEFEIEGQTREVGPGQMCIALADQSHSVRVLGDEPMTMYLSVTPHIQPTHTGRTPQGDRLHLDFKPSSTYDAVDADRPVGELIARQVEAALALAGAAQTGARVQQEMAVRLRGALAEGDRDEAERARNAVWEALFDTFTRVYELAAAWNDLSPRLAAAP